jgi:hypothetical protein
MREGVSRMRILLMIGWFAANVCAADFGGTWIGEIPSQNNGHRLRMAQQVAFLLVQNSGTLTGKLYGDYDSSPIIEGKVTGETIDFIVVTQEQQGNQINQSRMHFTGAIKPDGTIELSRVRETSTNSGNGGAYKGKATNGKQTFVIKRLG